MFKAVIFDFDDTLSYGPKGGYEAWDEVIPMFNLSKEQVEEGKRYIKENVEVYTSTESILRIKDIEEERRHHEKFYGGVAEAMGVDREKYVSFIVDRRLNWLEFGLYDDVLETLEKLKGEGLRLGMLSDAFVSRPNILKRAGIGKYFDAIGISGVVGYSKPDKKFFMYILDKLDVSAVEAFFIDDKEKNVISAIELGLHGAVMDRKNTLECSLTKVHNLDELLKVISSPHISIQ